MSRDYADPWHVNSKITDIAADRVRKDDRHKIAPHVFALEQQRSHALKVQLGDGDGNQIDVPVEATSESGTEAIVKAVHAAVESGLAKLKPS